MHNWWGFERGANAGKDSRRSRRGRTVAAILWSPCARSALERSRNINATSYTPCCQDNTLRVSFIRKRSPKTLLKYLDRKIFNSYKFPSYSFCRLEVSRRCSLFKWRLFFANFYSILLSTSISHTVPSWYNNGYARSKYQLHTIRVCWACC